jgi:pimeloyl-ACP methyl ester carboxylesterase
MPPFPSLFFLPGAGADPGFWRPAARRLPAAWSKTFFAWPGLGAQPGDPRVRGFGDFARLVADRLEGAPPVDLLAQSMAGAIALRLALDRPDRIRRLVLSATSGGIDARALGGVDWRADYRREYPHADLTLLDGWPDLIADLPRVRQPVLLLWGDADPISPVAVGRRLAGLLPAARLVVARGAGHSLVYDRPDAAARAILAHLS